MVLLVWQSFAENEWLGAFLSAVAAGRDIPPPPPAGTSHPRRRTVPASPFSLGDADRVRAVLTAAGFSEPELVGVREPMFYGRDVATAEAMVLGILGGMLVDLDDTANADAMVALRATLQAHLGAADALAAFQKARGHLVEQLGIEPGPRLRDLESLILDHDEQLRGRGSSDPESSDAASGRPTGTVTFGFCDVEGSSRLWATHRRRWLRRWSASTSSCGPRWTVTAGTCSPPAASRSERHSTEPATPLCGPPSCSWR